MELLTSLDQLATHVERGTCLSIGVFDGVHRGHQLLIRRANQHARQLGAKSMVMTFRHHPLALLAPPYAPPMLSSPESKAALIAQHGADLCLMLDFTREFSAISAEAFLEDIVARACRARVLVCGDDFRFGAQGRGDIAMIERRAGELGYTLDVVPPLLEAQQPIKSTRIRLALLAGRLAEARELLGRPYALRARVVRGDGRGRTIGFPTANLEPSPERLVPEGGVYAVRLRLEDGHAVTGPRPGMMNIGHRPTFQAQGRTVEVHLFDFDGDLYGREVVVTFEARLRDERRFESVEALIAQLQDDEAACRALLAEARE